jgi:hypothetical protein
MAWKSVIKEPPPIGQTVWAYCIMYKVFHLAKWIDGDDLTDKGTPFLRSLIERGDDYHLNLWKECKLPKDPHPKDVFKSKKEYEEYEPPADGSVML